MTPMKSSVLIGFPIPATTTLLAFENHSSSSFSALRLELTTENRQTGKTGRRKGLSLEFPHQFLVGVVNFYSQGHLSHCEVSGASEAWVVCSERHFNPVQYALIDVSVVYETFGCVAY